MRPSDLLLYLVGNRGAIERIAASRQALWAGALLVVSAGIARNYDHLSLLAQPEWILGPFGMSLFSAGLIWLMLMAGISVYSQNGKDPAFRTFLTFFWLTAPCAWLYGFPVERFTDLLRATQWNFAFLIVVSVWRMALIVRVVTVLTGAATGRVLAWVMLPACIEMGLGSLIKGLSLISIMGGVRLPPHHAFIKQASGVVMTGSFWLGLASLLAIIVYVSRESEEVTKPLCRDRIAESPGVILTSAAFLLGWILIAIPAQGPVRQTYQLSQYFADQQWRTGIKYAAARQRSDFSGIHFLPPDPYARKYGGAIFRVLEAMDGSEPEWLRRVWISQALMYLDLRVMYINEDADAKALARYPEIMSFLALKAVRLKAQLDPEWEDERWLRYYEEYFSQPQKTESAPP
ncbi:MAG: hypothetical protein V4675_15985 [Verrucomicrobiota bacterium]